MGATQGIKTHLFLIVQRSSTSGAPFIDSVSYVSQNVSFKDKFYILINFLSSVYCSNCAKYIVNSGWMGEWMSVQADRQMDEQSGWMDGWMCGS